jgi:hypothetical protein
LQPALAGEWRKAQTQHFNVYGEVKESELRTAASDLERYHRLLAAMMKVDDKAAVARLDIYLVSKREDLGQVEPDLDRAVVGFYRAGPGGRAAFAAWADRDRDEARHILQHEYAHHFMRQYFAWSYPVWFTEGFAEYFAPTVVRGDTIELGAAADMTGQVCWKASPGSRWTRCSTARQSASRGGMVYAQGWLLTHYMLRDPARIDQLQAYFAALRAGQARAGGLRRRLQDRQERPAATADQLRPERHDRDGDPDQATGPHRRGRHDPAPLGRRPVAGVAAADAGASGRKRRPGRRRPEGHREEGRQVSGRPAGRANPGPRPAGVR